MIPSAPLQRRVSHLLTILTLIGALFALQPALAASVDVAVSDADGIAAVGQNHADSATAENVSFYAQYREVGRFDAIQITAVGTDIQGTDVEVANLAGQACADVDRYYLPLLQSNTTTEEHSRGVEIAWLGKIKIVSSFEKELALFWEKQIESRQIDLALVHLYLREVGVVGNVCRKVVSDSEFYIDARLTIEFVINRGIRQPVCGDGAQAIRLNLNIEVSRGDLQLV